ncbi:MAG: putative Ig domain-containing protein [Frankiaceae bacterium]|jgi:hypothetical protein|nr:putative Ig domain-containing protein [Frankiaceae bacterium]
MGRSRIAMIAIAALLASGLVGLRGVMRSDASASAAGGSAAARAGETSTARASRPDGQPASGVAAVAPSVAASASAPTSDPAAASDEPPAADPGPAAAAEAAPESDPAPDSNTAQASDSAPDSNAGQASEPAPESAAGQASDSTLDSNTAQVSDTAQASDGTQDADPAPASGPTPVAAAPAPAGIGAGLAYPVVPAGQMAPAGTTVFAGLAGLSRPTIRVSGLPAGLSVDPATGALSGAAPATPGGYPITITATSAGGADTTQSVLVVAATSPLPATAAPQQGAYPMPPGCERSPTEACLTDYVNIGLLIEGYAASFSLPAGYDSASPAQQLILAAGALRASYGRTPRLDETSAGDDVAQQAADAADDPTADMMSRAGISSNATWAGNWAGDYSSSLQAIAEWMYRDGPGGANDGCSASASSDCYGHRHAILGATPSGDLGLAHIGAGYAVVSYPGISRPITSYALFGYR